MRCDTLDKFYRPRYRIHVLCIILWPSRLTLIAFVIIIFWEYIASERKSEKCRIFQASSLIRTKKKKICPPKIWTNLSR